MPKKLKSSRFPTHNVTGTRFLTLKPELKTKHFGREQLVELDTNGFECIQVTVWLTKDETCWNPEDKLNYAKQGPGKAVYRIAADSSIGFEFSVPKCCGGM